MEYLYVLWARAYEFLNNCTIHVLTTAQWAQLTLKPSINHLWPIILYNSFLHCLSGDCSKHVSLFLCFGSPTHQLCLQARYLARMPFCLFIVFTVLRLSHDLFVTHSSSTWFKMKPLQPLMSGCKLPISLD